MSEVAFVSDKCKIVVQNLLEALCESVLDQNTESYLLMKAVLMGGSTPNGIDIPNATAATKAYLILHL